MRDERRVLATDAVAEALPFDDDSVDAATAISTIHQVVGRLRSNLQDGTWDRRSRHLRTQFRFVGASPPDRVAVDGRYIVRSRVTREPTASARMVAGKGRVAYHRTRR